MANKKITDLPELSAIPDNTDLLEIVDVGGTPTSKKITVANLRGGLAAETAWTDYSATSTITGFSAYNYKLIEYKKIGSLVLVHYILQGTSDNTATSFTVPQTARGQAGVAMYQGNPPIVATDNSTAIATAVRAYIADNTSTIVFNTTQSGGAWTASGTKAVAGLFIFTE